MRVIAPSHPAKTYPEERVGQAAGDNKSAPPQDDDATTVSKYLSALSQREWDSLPLPSLPAPIGNKSQAVSSEKTATKHSGNHMGKKSSIAEGSSQSNASTLTSHLPPVDKDILELFDRSLDESTLHRARFSWMPWL